MPKRFFALLAVFVIGGGGGVVFERTLIPWMASRNAFQKVPRLTLERTTVVQPKEEVIIDRAEAFEHAAAAVRSALVRVERRGARGQTLMTASGVAATSDGVIATALGIASDSGDLVVLHNGNVFPAKVVATDAVYGVALLRIEASGLPVLSFADSVLPLGAAVFTLVADVDAQGALDIRLDAGYVIAEREGAPATNIPVSASSFGAPVFTIEGKLLGIAGEGGIIPAAAIRELLEKR